MIPLRVRAQAEGHSTPFIARLSSDYGRRSGPSDYVLVDLSNGVADFENEVGQHLGLHDIDPLLCDGDVMLIQPKQNLGHRLIRAQSPDNTLVLTERCDQVCVMCSQPPKAKHSETAALLQQAAVLAPPGVTIGISGGEPTLYKGNLFHLLHQTLSARSDLKFHVLSNAQHFEEEDIPVLRLLPPGSVTWGIPIYSADSHVHDEIVQKPGAFERLCSSLEILCRAGAAIELRTVVMTRNYSGMGQLGQFISTHVPFSVRWAIMQLENIGFARANWADLFVDTSSDFAPLAEGLDLAHARGLSALLYNFPKCTVPPEYRKYAPSTISDWKRRFLPACNHCAALQTCSGFFEWYSDTNGFSGVQPI